MVSLFFFNNLMVRASTQKKTSRFSNFLRRFSPPLFVALHSYLERNIILIDREKESLKTKV